LLINQFFNYHQKNGASALGLQQVLCLKSQQTVWTRLHKIRKAMVNPNRSKLSETVEIDKTYIGGETIGKHGRGAGNKVLEVIAVELDGKRLDRYRMQIISRCLVKFVAPVYRRRGGVWNTGHH
jgi:hypothetical protein